jgi:hypothetical protein
MVFKPACMNEFMGNDDKPDTVPGITLNARRGKDFDTLHFSAPPFSTFQGYALLAVMRGLAQLHVTAAAGSPESLSLALRVTDKLFPPLARYGRGQK